ncbi:MULTISPECIES: transcriptional regulator [Actinosynnema]|uniref:Transcriptional regulator n=1 Tax=Actinosynnema pretiosum TaxID=42197 RepID=A0A290ZE57_9PSEU|nr:transcriptional regulator [Actinosynnema pretiosum]ATE57252.1 transcriptional regulator [Actinosynnema pretiosum]
MPKDDHVRGAGTGSALPGAGQALDVDPSAIPSLKSAFSGALSKLDQQIEMAVTEVRVRPWAGDPVSIEAAEKFNERSVDSGDSALDALQGYQRQLKSAMDALTLVERQYQVIEDDNSGLMEQQGGC